EDRLQRGLAFAIELQSERAQDVKLDQPAASQAALCMFGLDLQASERLRALRIMQQQPDLLDACSLDLLIGVNERGRHRRIGGRLERARDNSRTVYIAIHKGDPDSLPLHAARETRKRTPHSVVDSPLQHLVPPVALIARQADAHLSEIAENQ